VTVSSLLICLLGLALVDSLNPSVLAVTIYLAFSGKRFAVRIATYLLGVLVTYATLGVALLMGAQTAGPQISAALQSRTAYLVQAVVGAAMFGYGLLAPSRPSHPGRWRREPTLLSPAALFALGATVSVLEFSTALPFLAAIALISRAGLHPAVAVVLIVAYTVVMLSPAAGLLLIRRLSARRHEERLQRWGERLQGQARGAFLTVVCLVGFVLLADAAYTLDLFGVRHGVFAG
jgi:cytochrome c biogenesis protein CcdA